MIRFQKAGVFAAIFALSQTAALPALAKSNVISGMRPVQVESSASSQGSESAASSGNAASSQSAGSTQAESQGQTQEQGQNNQQGQGGQNQAQNQAQSQQPNSSVNGVLPKVSVDVDTLRARFTTGHAGDMTEDPVLQLIPLATYYVYNGNGDRIDYGYTQKNDSFVFAEGGFQRMMLEHQNVGRWYYRTYASSTGWGPWAASKEKTPDRGTVQAVQFRIKGYTHKLGTLYYRAVLNDGTMTDWAKEGQACGVIGGDRYIVGLKLALWKNEVPFENPGSKFLDNEHNEGFTRTEGGAPVYATADGHAYTGWAFDEDSNQLYFENGSPVTGWKAIDGYNCYFSEHGIAVKDLEPVMGAQKKGYAVRINKATRTATILARDSAGKFTIPFKTFMISCGTDTPLGDFKIYEKYRWHFMHQDCYTQFLSRFYQGFLIHSLLYTRADLHTFDAINYNYMDQAISGGCIRMKAGDAAWVYHNCGNGTPVTIYSDPWDKGPLEKDAIDQAIPRSQDYDPTDPVIVGQQSEADKQAVAKAQADAAREKAAGAIEPHD